MISVNNDNVNDNIEPPKLISITTHDYASGIITIIAYKLHNLSTVNTKELTKILNDRSTLFYYSLRSLSLVATRS